jgi:segregation and condensation protein B
MTDDTAGAVDIGGSAEPGGADEIAEARFADEELRAAAGSAAGSAPGSPLPLPMSGVAVDRQLEAILMIADEPQSLVALATAVGSPVAVVRQAVERLVADFDGEDGGIRRGFELREVGGGWRFYVRAELDPVVDQFVQTENPSRLSQAALETLAVVAYKQPVTRSQIASIRAVNVDGVVRTLTARGLIAESFTDSETGAINYVTTDLLLVQLGINSLDELPLISPLLEDGAEGFDNGSV